MHHFQAGMLRPDAPPQLSPLLPRQPLRLPCPCRCIVRHVRPILCVVWAKTRPGRDAWNTLSNGVVPASVEAVATNLRIDKTRAILVYGQDRASVMTAIACRVSLPPFSRSFWLLRRRPAPLGTRVNAWTFSKSLCSQKCEHGTHECVRYSQECRLCSISRTVNPSRFPRPAFPVKSHIGTTITAPGIEPHSSALHRRILWNAAIGRGSSTIFTTSSN
jgi:hypothetical protein